MDNDTVGEPFESSRRDEGQGRGGAEHRPVAPTAQILILLLDRSDLPKPRNPWSVDL